MFFSRRAGHKWVDRGNQQTYDYGMADLIKDSAYHPLDISSKIDKGAVLVLLRLRMRSTGAGSECIFRTYGDTGEQNISSSFTQVDSTNVGLDVWVAPNKDGVIEYQLHPSIDQTLKVNIRGWFV